MRIDVTTTLDVVNDGLIVLILGPIVLDRITSAVFCESVSVLVQEGSWFAQTALTSYVVWPLPYEFPIPVVNVIRKPKPARACRRGVHDLVWGLSFLEAAPLVEVVCIDDGVLVNTAIQAITANIFHVVCGLIRHVEQR